MKTNNAYEATRRAFLQTCAVGLGMAGLEGAFPSQAIPQRYRRLPLPFCA